MRKALSLFMALLLMSGMIAGLQDGAVAKQASTGPVSSIVDTSGNEVATVSLDAIIDSFDDYTSGYDPQNGYRYVLLTVTITNTGEADYATQVYGFSAVDSDGFLINQSYLTYDTTKYGEPLADTSIAPGKSVTGTVAFEVLKNLQVETLIYSPSYDRATILATDAKVPAAGEPVEIVGEDGGTIGSITVDEVSDPLADIDPSYAPARGYHYLGVQVTVENSGKRSLSVDPSAFGVIDADGFLNGYYGAYRTSDATETLPDLQYADVAPGENASGIVSFQVYNESAPAFLVWRGSSSQFVFVASFEGAANVPAVADIPTETAAASTPAADQTATVDETPAANGTPSAQLSPECQAAAEWSQQINTLIETLNQDTISIEDVSDLEKLTTEELNGEIDRLNDFLDALDEIDTPEIAKDLRDALVNMIEVQIDGVQAVIDAKENGDNLQAVYDEYKPKSDAAAEDFFTAVADIQKTCPTALD